ncbi:L,D-transpeptidase [Pseudonocardia spirodelae]|uniref:Ig-like domain-containing protein n=1 Tax=Pseudonocardia spirodelae TaxID=3133431 RepID=A0ABU8T0V4_9PSEU
MSRSWEHSRGRHTPRRRRRSLHRRSLALLGAGLVALVVLVAGGTAAVAGGRIGDTLARNVAGAVDRLRPAPEAPPVPQVLTSLPATGTAPVAPRGPVRTAVSTGTLQGVALTGDSGDGPVTVPGTLSPDGRTWTASGPLDFATTYRWSGSWVLGPQDRRPVPAAPFSTVDPGDTVEATMNIRDGGEVGVGAPIVLTFGEDLSDTAKAAVERALTVTASKKAEGAWAWLPDTAEGSRVHYRPKAYWPAHTEVRVQGALRGLDLGGDTWMTEDLDRSFTVGRSQVVRADTRSHAIVVVRDGREVARYDASYGLESDPRRVTRSGVHVVMAKSEKVLMSNPDYGYVDEPQFWAVRISNNGEFIHANPASSWAQGSRNVSHGCVNLSTRDAKEFFASATFGDPVEVTGSSQPLTAADGDLYDWAVPWDEWRSLSALR